MKTTLLFLLSAALLTGCQSQYAEMETSGTPDYAAIAKAANLAVHQYMTKLSREEQTDNLIPRQFWGKAIEQLNPIRVEFDRVNVAIVMSENDRVEEGYYFIPMISSYIPFDKEGVSFEKLTSPEDVGMTVIPGDLSYYTKPKK